jgi:hypothetical protein
MISDSPYTIAQDIINIIWLACALFLAGVLESFLWKTPVFQYLNFPINNQLFGANKRWRGLVSLPLANLVATYVFYYLDITFFERSKNLIHFSDYNCLEYGLLVGLVFNLSELPNSYIKRRLQIPPGDESNPWFYLVDHLDSTYGVLLLWWLYFQFPLHLIITGLFVTPILFIGATWLRKKLGFK